VVFLDRHQQAYGIVAMVGDGLKRRTSSGPSGRRKSPLVRATDLARETAVHSCCPPVGFGCCRGRLTRRPRGSHDDPHQPDVGVRL